MGMSEGSKKVVRFQHFHQEELYTFVRRARRSLGMSLTRVLWFVLCLSSFGVPFIGGFTVLILGCSGVALLGSRKFVT